MREKGFTLVEIMLVLVVTAVVFLAVYSLFASTVKHDLETRYELIASNLAQEGIEIMRNMRDENQMRGFPLDNAFPETPCRPYLAASGGPRCDSTKQIEVEYNGTIYKNCEFAGCGAADQTAFSRNCTKGCDNTDAGGDCIQMTVECVVSWNSFINPGISREAKATSVLTSWQD
ncbi:MAG: prepilin-type N-terminal cleavage/methylation domain-containing protein [Patescibacteria group bacterium]|nr:prepilin-type N-terminal cleavage/methylation domain-containing protein [Patescibacteria group bacterium]